jgi:hypothetical protein
MTPVPRLAPTADSKRPWTPSQFEQAMSVLAAAPAQPRILVATIPNANPDLEVVP